MENTKANQRIIQEIEKEHLFIKMVTSMKEIGKMVNKMEGEFIILVMGIDLMENGKMYERRRREIYF